MYRAVAWYLWEQGIKTVRPEKLPEWLAAFSLHLEREGEEMVVYVGDRRLEEELRRPEVGAFASEVSAVPWVRERLIAEQRRLGQQGGVVMDGRDIGTVVFPHAELKIFMCAALEARVQRRYQELVARGLQVDAEAIRQELLERDRRDETRPISPLRKAPDARVLDTTHLTIPQQIETVINWAQELIYAPASF